MSYWTLTKLQTRVRRLTGKPTENEYATADLTERINYYYQMVMPGVIQADYLHGYYVATITVASDTLTLSDTVISVAEPLTLDLGVAADGHDPNYFWDPITDSPDNAYNLLIVDRDPVNFYSIWPNTQTWDAARPSHVLLYGRQILFRPPPDGTYTFRCPAHLRPDALSASGDYLPQDAWGELVALGTAIDILQEDQDELRLRSLAQLYAMARARAQQGEFEQTSALLTRPVGRW